MNLHDKETARHPARIENSRATVGMELSGAETFSEKEMVGKPVGKWPFFVADGGFVAAAALLVWLGEKPLSPALVAFAVLFILLGAGLAVVPFLLDYMNGPRLAGAGEAERSAGRMQRLEAALVELGGKVSGWESWVRNAEERAGALEGLQQELAELRNRLEELNAAEKPEFLTREEWEAAFHETEEKALAAREEIRRELARVEAICAELAAGEAEVSEGEFRVSGEEVEGRVESVAEEDEVKEAEEPGLRETGEEVEGEADGEVVGEAEPVVERPVKARKSAGPKLQVREEAPGSLFSTSTIVATAFIGSGNQVFLRGEGAGLSWRKGVPMRSVEAGKWSWTVADAVEPVRVHLFKNDEVPDKSGVLTLEPGQRLDVRPEF